MSGKGRRACVPCSAGSAPHKQAYVFSRGVVRPAHRQRRDNDVRLTGRQDDEGVSTGRVWSDTRVSRRWYSDASVT